MEHLKLTFHGVCGSYPSLTNPVNFRTTPCIYVQSKNSNLILDAGTGIIPLGNQLVNTTHPIYICLSHFHFDHVLGIPYFKPLYDSNIPITIIHPYPKQVKSVLSQLFQPNFFPLDFSIIEKKLAFLTPKEATKKLDFTLSHFPLNHPGECHAYVIEHKSKKIIYATDNELTTDNMSHFENCFKHADILIHDAYFFKEPQEKHKGWGHSFIQDVFKVAHQSKVKHLCLFHYKPDLNQAYFNAISSFMTTFTKKHTSLKCSLSKAGLSITM